MRQNGFTLIEWIMVVATILIILALFIPAIINNADFFQ
uniref:Uncharacterized protein n=1 Tax=viral metagenome TaxID=1070528 RepID=A0A6C0JVX0_9ZZZZ